MFTQTFTELGYHSKNRQIYLKKGVQKLKKYIFPGKILDVGCGQCRFIFAHHKIPNTFFTAIDINLQYLDFCLKKAKRLKVKNARFLKMDAQAPNFPPSSFDQILAIGVIEHLKKPLRALKNWTKLLKKGGILILSTPNKNLKFFQRFLGKNPYHVREFGYFELKKILQKDYQVIATEKSFLASVEIPFFQLISFLWERFFPPFLSPESIFICKKKKPSNF